ncbi:MAG: ATP-binding protein [Thermoplasmata archaeon]|nr:ATP-binding protein [Thermoplasmata archaeon]
MLYGRERELNALEKRYNSGKIEFVPVFGRRRVGKTTLIREFAKGKNAVYYCAVEGSLEENVRGLAEALGVLAIGAAPIESVLEVVRKKSESERFVLIIDEYPELVKSSKGIGTKIRKFLDSLENDSKLFLILTGSSLSLMKHEILGTKSALYDRRTGTIDLMPLKYHDARLMLHGFSEEDRMRIFTMVGGVPWYLEHFDPRMDLHENLINNFLEVDSYFKEEHTLLLLTEFRTPRTYNKILSSLASGNTRNTDIAKEAGIPAPMCSEYLDDLCEVHIVEKRRPADNPSGKAVMYFICDQYLRFHFACVRPRMRTSIQPDMMKTADAVIKQIDRFVGRSFEVICAEYLTARFGGESWTWWGGDPKTGVQEEIDLIQTVDDEGVLRGYFTECKYRNEKVGPAVLDDLVRKSHLVHGYDDMRYVVCSKSGFTDGFEDRDVILLTYEEIAGIDESEKPSND